MGKFTILKNKADAFGKRVEALNHIIDEYRLEFTIINDFFKKNPEIHEKFKSFEDEWLMDPENGKKFVGRD